MAAIDIPDDYWTVRPRGFAGLVQPSSAALGVLAGELAGSGDAIVGADATATAPQLADVDGDAAALLAAAVNEYTAVVTTPTGAVLAAAGVADQQTRDTDGQQPVNTLDPGGPRIDNPPAVDPNVFPGAGPSENPRFGDNPPPRPTPPAGAPPADAGAVPLPTDQAAPAPDAAESTAAAALPDGSTTGSGEPVPVPPSDEPPPPPSPDDQPVTRAELAALLGKLSPTVTVVV